MSVFFTNEEPAHQIPLQSATRPIRAVFQAKRPTPRDVSPKKEKTTLPRMLLNPPSDALTAQGKTMNSAPPSTKTTNTKACWRTMNTSDKMACLERGARSTGTSRYQGISSDATFRHVDNTDGCHSQDQRQEETISPRFRRGQETRAERGRAVCDRRQTYEADPALITGWASASLQSTTSKLLASAAF